MTMASGGVRGPPHPHHFPPTHSTPSTVPMKLFATWEVERTPPNCIPRLCSLTLARLAIYKQLDTDISSLVIAVKMQSSKRTLRSNEIPLPASGLLDTELELAFSLQYPHFLKREGNKLQIMLQRRKKYKNRTILGYKTLAVGEINMSQVLQRQMDMELELVEGKEERKAVLARIYMLSLSSQPVDHEDLGKPAQGDRELDSEDEEDFSSPDEGSDSEPMLEERDLRGSAASSRRKSKALANSAARQRNMRQKFVALLRRFKVNEPEELRALKASSEQASQLQDVDPEEIDDLLNELEDYSDYGPELDTTSVGSTPKPSLRPFFSSSRSLIREALDNPGGGKGYSILERPEPGSDHLSDDSSKGALSDSHPETLTDPEHSDPPANTNSPPQSGDEVRRHQERAERREEKRGSKHFMKDMTFSIKSQAKAASINKERLERMNSANNLEAASPRKVLLEQLARVLPSDDSLPEQVLLANTGDPQASHLASKLSDTGAKVILTAGPADVRAALTCLVTRLQKYCNTNIAPPACVRVGLIGSDSFLNSMLRPYVELFSSKPPDWQHHIVFYVIPLGSNSISRGLASRCATYARLFHDDTWRELLDRPEPTRAEVQELVGRVGQYLALAHHTQLPIAEAMVTYKEKLTDDESSQVFVPFVSDVRVGNFGEEENEERERRDTRSPPSSPNISKYSGEREGRGGREEEVMELQLDYWGQAAREDREPKLFGTKENKENGKQDSDKAKKLAADPKSSIKTSFRNLSISHLGTSSLASHSSDLHHTFAMTFLTKEKKPKVALKLGKKKHQEGEGDRQQQIEGISRLICMAKSAPLRVAIDGHEWTGVKFFQLSGQWQTHIKYCPVAIGGGTLPGGEQY